MATGTRLPQEDILNKVWNSAGTGPSPTGDSLSFYLLSGSGQVTAVLGSGTFQGLGPNPLIVAQPAFRQFVLDSVTTGSSSATGTWTTGLGGYRHVVVYLRFTTMTGTASTVNLLVDSRLDGTNSVNLGQFSQVASGTGGTSEQVMILSRNIITNQTVDASAVSNATGDRPVSTAFQMGWGDDLRIRRDVSGGTTAPIFTYRVTVNAQS